MTGQASSFKEASLNCGCGAFDPPMRVERRSERRWHCLRGIQPEGPGSCRTGPEHVAPITGYGAKAPVGFPCWMSRSTPALPYREGTADRGAWRRAQPVRKAGTWTNPRRNPTRPAPSLGGRELKHHAGPCPCGSGRASFRESFSGLSRESWLDDVRNFRSSLAAPTEILGTGPRMTPLMWRD